MFGGAAVLAAKRSNGKSASPHVTQSGHHNSNTSNATSDDGFVARDAQEKPEKSPKRHGHHHQWRGSTEPPRAQGSQQRRPSVDQGMFNPEDRPNNAVPPELQRELSEGPKFAEMTPQQQQLLQQPDILHRNFSSNGTNPVAVAASASTGSAAHLPSLSTFASTSEKVDRTGPNSLTGSGTGPGTAGQGQGQGQGAGPNSSRRHHSLSQVHELPWDLPPSSPPRRRSIQHGFFKPRQNVMESESDSRQTSHTPSYSSRANSHSPSPPSDSHSGCGTPPKVSPRQPPPILHGNSRYDRLERQATRTASAINTNEAEPLGLSPTMSSQRKKESAKLRFGEPVSRQWRQIPSKDSLPDLGGPSHIPSGSELSYLVEGQDRLERALLDLHDSQRELLKTVGSIHYNIHQGGFLQGGMSGMVADPAYFVDTPGLDLGPSRSDGQTSVVGVGSGLRSKSPSLGNLVLREGMSMSSFGESQNGESITDSGHLGSESDVHESEESDTGFLAPSLPPHWPSTLRCRNIVNALNQRSKSMLGQANIARRVEKSLSSSFMANIEPALPMDNPAWSGRIPDRWRDPLNPFHVFWESIGMIVLLYDLSMVPFLLAWEVELKGSLEILAMTSCFYWSIDLFMNCFKGFYRNETLVADQSIIMRRYTRTWFAPDLCLVTLDWICLPMVEDMGDTRFRLLRFVKLGKAIRLLSLLKLLRLMKFLKLVTIHLLGEGQMADQFGAYVRIFMIAIATLWINHVLSCLWFAIGRFTAPHGPAWVTSMAAYSGGEPFRESSLAYQYFTALHWAMAQSTLGAMEVTSTNTAERVYTIFCLVFGLIVGSSLVSTLSASMVEVQMMHQDRNNQLRLLRRYLQENSVRNSLGILVQRQGKERLSNPARLKHHDVPVLNLLSSDLCRRLQAEICGPFLVRHPLFRVCMHLDDGWLAEFCMSAVSVVHHHKDDNLFLAGNRSENAFVLIDGSIQYLQDPETSPALEATSTNVDHYSWLCEAALWAEWVHVGRAVTTSSTRMLVINADACSKAFMGNRLVLTLAAEYCRGFHSRLASAKPPMSSWPSDLGVPFTEFGDLVAMMGLPNRLTIGRLVCRLAESKGGRGFLQSVNLEEMRQQLIAEVEMGTSVLILDEEGLALRALTVVALKMTRADGKVLVKLGEYDQGQGWRAEGDLPYCFRAEGESTADALTRCIEDKLNLQTAALHFRSVSADQKGQANRRFGFDTLLLRRVYDCELLQTLEGMPLQCVTPGHTHITSTVANFRSTQSGVERGRSSATAVFDMLVRNPCFYIGNDESGGAYAWLSTLEYETLMSNEPERAATLWLEQLVLPFSQEVSSPRRPSKMGRTISA